jgi:hypothetical protein
MKSEHRHELKTNELAEWIGNLPQWTRKNYRTITYVSVVAVLVIGSASWYWYNKNVESVREQLNLTSLIAQLPQSKMRIVTERARGVDTSIMLIQVADNLESAADSVKDNQMAALALIKHAEALRTALHYRQGSVSRPELEAATNRAKAGYGEALKQASPNASLMATAKLGLGLCEEELGNFENAKQIYRELATNTGLEGTTAIVQAKQRLKTMADYQKKIVFKALPKRPEFIQPPFELQPKEPDILSEFPGIDLKAKTVISPPELPDTNLVPEAPNSAPETSDINAPDK